MKKYLRKFLSLIMILISIFCIDISAYAGVSRDTILSIEHKFDLIVSDPTCTEEGYTTYVCTECGYTYNDDYEEPYGHMYNDTVVVPTCTSGGYTQHICMLCGYSHNDSFTEKLPHKFVSDEKYCQYNCGAVNPDYTEKTLCEIDGHSYQITTINPTCTEEGYTDYICKNCGYTYTEVIPAAGHIPTADKAVAPTCTSAGLTEGSHCSTCGSVITAQKTIKAAGHSFDKGRATKAATCTATGVTTFTCTNCKATKTEAIAKNVHADKTLTEKATAKKTGKIESKCTLCGNVSKTVAINAIKSVSLAKTSYVYDGKTKNPTVTVKDSKGKKIDAKYYTVKYSSNKNVGKATVTVTFKGNYSGTVKKTFTIKPKATSISKLTAGKKKVTVKWKKLATQTTGYQIQYSTDKNFKKNNKTVTVSKNKTTSKSISKLKAKKKYYVRIRTYKTVNGSKIYSDWSKAKTVTTKK